MLDERKLAVLRAVVEDFVNTNEPVGSRALADRHPLGVSPATIRNDMVALEEEGYITQPHTSAGRVPTDKGYRLFVDRLSSVKPLSAAERRAIESFLGGAVDLDEIVARTVRLLAQLTRQVAIVQYPSLTRSSVQHVELVPLGGHRIMMVVITNTGRVEQRVIDGLGVVDESVVEDLRSMLNRAIAGKHLGDVPDAVEDLPAQVAPEDRSFAIAVLSVLLESLVERHEEKIVLAGTANLAAVDFAASLRDVLEALEENMVLIRLLGEAKDPSMLTVRIGAENFHEGLRSTSIVSADYGVGNQSLAKIGVVGPTRMDYPGTMGAVRAVARYVGQILAGQ
ncbi:MULTISPECIES: heat-inducible transcriptional repressor HrcA [Nocardiopsis]|uniref:Heat-inducible transcription repressor HrcA n=2 Tax=Nocardiopsis alba TaxID=53437 RepID=A0A7K2IWF7_9ACTN|nr:MULTISPECIES: heat-inducible transcriptional repressor HrcA [Nocardiopsis]AFR08214.1 heat-inducible transcription repressor HrcA [Nocardiopsis alba ATCC BAA-2165]MEC3892357.1 heat-inducible transcriptional repressor HrcA [Nocardiopsis sp. LDBS1602]MYR34283.1 heat-inducible transcriptional repressor HrcA [Nocardiopsis alba]